MELHVAIRNRVGWPITAFTLTFGAVALYCLLPTNNIMDLIMLSILPLLGGCVKYGDI